VEKYPMARQKWIKVLPNGLKYGGKTAGYQGYSRKVFHILNRIKK